MVQKKNIQDIKSKPRHDTYGLEQSLYLQENIRYRITVNIDTSDGLVNGATGIVYDWETVSCKNTTIVTSVWMLLDNPESGKIARSRKQHPTNPLLTNIPRIQREVLLFNSSRKGRQRVKKSNTFDF